MISYVKQLKMKRDFAIMIILIIILYLEEDNYVSVIDFDYCKREVRTFDISNFMIKVFKEN